MKKYLCLGYYNPAQFRAKSKEQIAAVVSQCQAHDQRLRDTGRMTMVASLSFPEDSVSIRPRNGKPVFTDGPFTEAKEMVGSFWLIEAEDIAEAKQIAALHPAANLGEDMGWGVEVWPIETCQAITMTQAA